MPLPGAFGKPDLYCRRHWKRVQHICNKFSNRWHKEFLATLQDRQKWLVPRRNFYIGDVVLLKEDANRNEWINVYPGEKGHVRSVQLYVGMSDPSKLLSCVLVRPIDKIILLVESDNEVQSLTEQPSRSNWSVKMIVIHLERSQLLRDLAAILAAIFDFKKCFWFL